MQSEVTGEQRLLLDPARENRMLSEQSCGDKRTLPASKTIAAGGRMLSMGNRMERRHPLSWPAAVSLLGLSLVILGDTCSRPEPKATEEAASQSRESNSSHGTPAPMTESAGPDSRPAAPISAKSTAASNPEVTPPGSPASPPPDGESAPTFEATVRPILATRCAPCHNPGGRMYERLPFDRPEVVAEHAAGVQRRLKDEDRKAFDRWLASLPKDEEPAR